MLNIEQIAQECDATGDAMKTTAGYQLFFNI